MCVLVGELGPMEKGLAAAPQVHLYYNHSMSAPQRPSPDLLYNPATEPRQQQRH